MIAVFAVSSLLLGAATAYAAERVPAHVRLLENSGGMLLVAGLMLLGSALPFVP